MLKISKIQNIKNPTKPRVDYSKYPNTYFDSFIYNRHATTIRPVIFRTAKKKNWNKKFTPRHNDDSYSVVHNEDTQKFLNDYTDFIFNSTKYEFYSDKKQEERNLKNNYYDNHIGDADHEKHSGINDAIDIEYTDEDYELLNPYDEEIAKTKDVETNTDTDMKQRGDENSDEQIEKEDSYTDVDYSDEYYDLINPYEEFEDTEEKAFKSKSNPTVQQMKPKENMKKQKKKLHDNVDLAYFQKKKKYTEELLHQNIKGTRDQISEYQVDFDYIGDDQYTVREKYLPGEHVPISSEDFTSDFPNEETYRNNKVTNDDYVPGVSGKDYPTFNKIPVTSFNCNGQYPGKYADPEAGCQVNTHHTWS